MAAHDSESYLGYLNKLLHQYHNNYHYSICKRPIIADCSALTKKIETNPKDPKFKVNDRVRLLSIRIFLAKVTLKVG